MEKTALKCSSFDDLICCVNKLEALGDIVGSLAFYDSDWLGWRGQEIGAMISDYSNSIKNTFDGIWQPIDCVLRNGDTSLLSELKTDQKIIQSGSVDLPGNFEMAKSAVKKINKFMDNNFKQLMDMAEYFGEIQKDIIRQSEGGPKEKEAPATADDQAEAPNPDQDRSDALKEVLHIEK